MAYLLSVLGMRLIELKMLHEAEVVHRRALCIGCGRLGFNDPRLSGSLDWLGLVLFMQGNVAEALLTCFATRALISKTKGSNHPSLCGCLMNMAMIYDALGCFLKASSLRDEATRLFF